MNGSYVASEVVRLSRPIIAFREYVFRDILPAFGNIDERANQVADEYFNLIGSQPVGEYGEIDMADVAEEANSRSYDWWEMMTSLRQSMLNLIAAGLFHLVEQQLANLSRDCLFDGAVRDTKLSIVTEWYEEKLGIRLTAMPSWNTIDEMRLVANTVKHGESGSARDLRALRPEMFTNPAYMEIYRSEGLSTTEAAREVRVTVPLSGDDFFVTEETLKGYAERAESFFAEIAAELAR